MLSRKLTSPMSTLMILCLIVVASAQRSSLADDPIQKISVSVTRNRLVFKTRADYEQAVNEPKPEVRAQVFQRLQTLAGFTSSAATPRANERTAAGNAATSALITDEQFRSILNPDLVVQIGDYIFKLNPTTEKIYALAAAHEADYADLLAERTANPNIREFSTNDDVLNLLTSDQGNQRCTESGIAEHRDHINVSSQGVDLKGTVMYLKWGIYFTLMAEIDTGQSRPPAKVDLAPVYYHVRCGNTVGPYTVNDYDISHKQVYHSYQGSKPLNEIDLRARFHVQGTNVNNVTVNLNTPWVEIKVNYKSMSGLPPDGLDYPHNPNGYTLGQYSISRPTLTRGPVTSWSILPALPAGLVLNATTGVIDGVPTTTAPAADRMVTAANAYGSTTKLLHMAAVSLPVAPSNLIYPVNSVIYVMGQDVLSSTPKYNGGKVTSWSVTPALPPGLNLEKGFDPTLGSGYIYGRPTTAQAAKAYTITAHNAGGSTSATLKIEIRDPGATLSGLTYSENSATYTVGKQIATNKPSLASGVPFAGFTVTPALPAGLTLAKSTGEIWGTPTQSQPTVTYAVTAHGSTALPGASVILRITILQSKDH